MTTNLILKGSRSFQLKVTDQPSLFNLTRVSKVGNSKPWDAVFSNPHHCSVRKIGPMDALGDRIVYAIDFNKNSRKDQGTIVLQTSSFLYPVGIGHEASDPCSYLFRIKDDNIFEVFVADISRIDDGILIQMFMDGSLAEEICDLQKRSA